MKKKITDLLTANGYKSNYSGNDKTLYVTGKDAETLLVQTFGQHLIINFKIVYK